MLCPNLAHPLKKSYLIYICNFLYSYRKAFVSFSSIMHFVSLCYLQDSMNCANDFFKYLCNWVLVHCSEEMTFVAKRIDNTCMNRLRQIISGSPEMMTYHKAIDVLRKVGTTKP